MALTKDYADVEDRTQERDKLLYAESMQYLTIVLARDSFHLKATTSMRIETLIVTKL